MSPNSGCYTSLPSQYQEEPREPQVSPLTGASSRPAKLATTVKGKQPQQDRGCKAASSEQLVEEEPQSGSCPGKGGAVATARAMLSILCAQTPRNPFSRPSSNSMCRASYSPSVFFITFET
ncbi:hypothetical protein CRG98_025740 [Punica granatum]|uniref:Uncharacterized protein n=1 Tax=Punica granatum TaxID=22663 RepID=A0A2I0JC81_PUNGR|nr:hypothetical protein CRG98_025740 [Punica granatum]